MNGKAIGVFCGVSILLIISLGVNIFLASTGGFQKKGEYTYDEVIEMYDTLAEEYEAESKARADAEASLEKTTTLYNELADSFNDAQAEVKEYKEIAESVAVDDSIDVTVPDLPSGAIGWVYIPSCDVSAFMHYGSTMQAIANKYVGEFEDTGEIGVGNYCILGHSNEKKKYVFSPLKENINIGDSIYIYKDKTVYKFSVGYYRVVDPDNVWILDDTGMELPTCTIMCCSDSGQRRFVVFANFVSKKVVG